MPLEIISDPLKKNPNLQDKTSPLVKVKTTLKNASSATMKKPQLSLHMKNTQSFKIIFNPIGKIINSLEVTSSPIAPPMRKSQFLKNFNTLRKTQSSHAPENSLITLKVSPPFPGNLSILKLAHIITEIIPTSPKKNLKHFRKHLHPSRNSLNPSRKNVNVHEKFLPSSQK